MGSDAGAQCAVFLHVEIINSYGPDTLSEKPFIKQLEVGRLAVFSYIICDAESKEGLIIDPGGNPTRIIRTAKEEGIQIRLLVNTHSHMDHILGNAKVIEKTGAKLIIHELERNSLTRFYKRFFNLFLGGSPSPQADILVKDGDTIEIGSLTFDIIHTPGHSRGGICIYGYGNLFTGDTLFVGGIGRVDLPGGSKKVLLHSIKNRLLVLPDETIIWPGHNYGPSPWSTVLQERLYNPFCS